MSRIPTNDRLLELLADRATQGLSASEQRELEALLAQNPGADEDALDLAAAAADLAMTTVMPAVPASLRAKLRSDAERWIGRADAAAPTAITRRPRLVLWSGWIAAAAALALAAVAWWPHADLTTQREVMKAKHPPMAWQPFMLENAGPAVQGVQGDVVWDEAGQKGFMRFVNLPVNDPKKNQYQVWLVDSRGMSFRISGGVFNSTSTGEIIVPITPAVATRGVGAVAVTIEPPGGVIVSDMTQRVVLAAKGG